MDVSRCAAADADPIVTRGSRTGEELNPDLTRWLLLRLRALWAPSECTCVDRTVVVVARAGGIVTCVAVFCCSDRRSKCRCVFPLCCRAERGSE